MPITPQQALQRTIEHREIFFDEMVDLMRQVMRGEVSPTVSFFTRRPVRMAEVSAGDTSPRMIWRIRSTISSKKISRCSMVRCRASCGVMGMVNAPGNSSAAHGRAG